MKTLLYFVLALLLCGCSVIHSQEPVGLTPKDLSNEVEEWEGCWRNNDGTLNVFVINATNGVIRAIGFKRDGADIKQESFDVYLRETGDWIFASMKDDDNEENLFVWGRVKMEDGVFLAWAPDTEKFTKLIHDGALPGTTNGTNGVLAPLSTNHYEIISNPDSIYFEWDDPMVFWKISE